MAENASSKQLFDTLLRVRRYLSQLDWLGPGVTERILMQNGEYYGNFFEFQNGTAIWKANSQQIEVELQNGNQTFTYDLDALASQKAVA